MHAYMPKLLLVQQAEESVGIASPLMSFASTTAYTTFNIDSALEKSKQWKEKCDEKKQRKRIKECKDQ